MKQKKNKWKTRIIGRSLILNALLYASFNILIVSNDEHAHIVHRTLERRKKKDYYTSNCCVCFFFSRAHIFTVLLVCTVKRK